jgi:20S proteasome alpha/beta subunit
VTVVVAFVARDGAVMASDSEATEEDQSRFDMAKLWTCHEFLLGYSGNTAIRDPLAAALSESITPGGTTNRWEAMANVCAVSGRVLSGAYENFVPAPPAGQIPQPLLGRLLVVGRDIEGYFIFEVNQHNVPTLASRGFQAVGSGSVAAQVANALMVQYGAGGRDVWHLKLIAYRTVDACIQALGGPYGVGGAIQLWASTNGGPFEQVTGSQLDAVAHGVDQWVGIESESLDEVAGEAAEPESDINAEATQLPDDLGDPGSRA